MRTKKPKAAKPTTIFSVSDKKEIEKEQPSSQPLPAMTDKQPSEESDVVRKNIAWYEDKDGKIQWGNMRQGTKDALKEFLQRPDIWKDLEVKKPDAPAKKLVSDDLIARGYEIFGKLESFLAQRATGCSAELAAEIFTFDDEEKAMLVPVTVKLINKHGPSWLSEWNEEIEFAIAFLSVQMSKFAMLRVKHARERERSRKNAPSLVSVPVPVRPSVEPEVPSAPSAAVGNGGEDSSVGPPPPVVDLEHAEASGQI